MSLESGKKSATEMRQAQKDMISKAESVQPTVAVMEPNWNALIASQKAQVKTLGEILEKFDTLTTEERLRAHLEMQLQILRSDGKASVEVMEQYRQTIMQEAKNTASTVAEWMESCRDVIAHFHIHNNDGRVDTHGSPLQGTIPMEQVLRGIPELCPEATVTLEMRDAAAGLEYLTRRDLLG